MNDEMRKAFEADYTKRYLGVNVGSALDKFESGMYKQADTHFVWLGFQAAYQLQQTKLDKAVSALESIARHDPTPNWQGAYAQTTLTEVKENK